MIDTSGRGLKTIVRLTSERTIKQTGKQTRETRYYTISLTPDPQSIYRAIRSHWAVENKLHWSLGVIFKEDASLKKRDHSALNFNIIAKAKHKLSITNLNKKHENPHFTTRNMK